MKFENCPVGTAENSPAPAKTDIAGFGETNQILSPVGTPENSPAIHCRKRGIPYFSQSRRDG